jgi:hypothetical protein
MFDHVDPTSFAARNLQGIDRWESWTPVPVSMTEVGTATYTGRFRVVGRKLEWQIGIVAGTSTACTAGTTYFPLPINATGLAGVSVAYNDATNVAIGVCAVNVSTSRIYPPAWTATGDAIKLAGSNEL